MKTRNLIFILSILILTACNTNGKKSERIIKTDIKMGKIQNNHEWDNLKEVVIGRYPAKTFSILDVDLALAERFPFIPMSSMEYMKKGENKMLYETYPDDDQLFYQEQEDFVALVKSLGIKVKRPDELEYHAPETIQNYSRDPIITIGNKFIITNLKGEHRRKETTMYLPIALDLVKNYGGEVVLIPANKEGYPDGNIYLKGGDVFVNGKEIYVGISGNATNEEGIEWLKNELGPEYTVHTIKLKHHVLHLDCAMMLMNENQGLICEEDFEDLSSIPESLKKYSWVKVTPEEAQHMATNGMVVNKSTVIITDAFPHIAEQIRAFGITAHEVPFKKAHYFGGGLRCSYQPIFRE